jgi:ubiquitin C-terminal hydrolase
MGYSNANRWPMSKHHSENLVECKDCGKLMAKSAWSCPHCGSARTETRKSIAIILFALTVFFVLMGVLKVFLDSYYGWEMVGAK